MSKTFFDAIEPQLLRPIVQFAKRAAARKAARQSGRPAALRGR